MLEPHACVSQLEIFHTHVPAADHLYQSRAAVEVMTGTGKCITPAIDDTTTGEGNVFGILGVNEGAEAIAVSPTANGGLRSERVILQSVGAKQAGSLFKVETHAGAQNERPGDMVAGWNNHGTTTSCVDLVDVGLEFLGHASLTLPCPAATRE
jgi:hypothetical protein